MLLSYLKNYNPDDALEQEQREQMISFLLNNSNCFERSCEKGHFTASAWVVDSEEKHILLLHHKKLDTWLQLGGHADGEYDLLKVAIKEAQEESGLKNIAPLTKEIFDIDIHLIPARRNEPAHYHYDVRFLLKSIEDDTLIKNEESLDIQWFSTDQSSLPTERFSILRMLNKWQNFQANKNQFEKNPAVGA